MMKPLTWWQKIVAYSSLVFVLLWTAFGLFAIYVLLTEAP